MGVLSPVLMTAAVVFGIFIIIRIFRKPIKFIFKMLINTAIGFLLLNVFNSFGGIIGFTLAINLVNALVVGILGVPGVILLILISLV